MCNKHFLICIVLHRLCFHNLEKFTKIVGMTRFVGFKYINRKHGFIIVVIYIVESQRSCNVS